MRHVSPLLRAVLSTALPAALLLACDPVDDPAPAADESDPQDSDEGVPNGLPTTGGVDVAPLPLRAGVTPRCVPRALGDPDGDPVTLTTSWWVDGAPVPAPGPLAAGQRVRCALLPHDGLDAGELATSAEVEVLPALENMLIVVLDDIGVDHVRAYGLAPDAPPTPTLDGLADEGVLFRRAWAAPVCSPSRVALLSGRYGRRFGIGSALGVFREAVELPPDTPTLPALVDAGTDGAYALAAFGKWHVGSFLGTGPAHPLAVGFGRFEGTLGNPMSRNASDGGTQSYVDWEEDVDGVLARNTRYLTTETADDALAWLDETSEPWLLHVAFNAAHRPFHVPPAALHTRTLGPSPSQAAMYDAMVEAMDTELGRLLEGLGDDVRERTHVILVGDNGTPHFVMTGPFDTSLGKGTLHEGGVRVPLIVTGPAVQHPGTTSDALVHVVDVLPTVAELLNVELPADVASDLDGVSFASAVVDPGHPGARDFVYAGFFKPNGWGPREIDEQAVWDGRFKLVHRTDGSEELYDLQDRVQEGPDLMGEALDADAELALPALRAELERVLAGP